MKKKEAINLFINRFNFVEGELLKRVFENDISCFVEITPIDNETEEKGDFFPIWNTFFTSKDYSIEEWIKKNLYKVAECGFRIYKYEETDSIYLGIDGAGYSFIDEHWEPLYDAIGCKWHDE